MVNSNKDINILILTISNIYCVRYIFKNKVGLKQWFKNFYDFNLEEFCFNFEKNLFLATHKNKN